MAGRRLGADEQALWRRVIADVRPLGPRLHAFLDQPVGVERSRDAKPPIEGVSTALDTNGSERSRKARSEPGETLDGGWDRRLRRGLVAPDRTIDLHGHTLASAHGALDHALDRAVGDGARLLLLVTGRAPSARDGGGPRRGVIRASIGDWLGASRHAGRIAAVRGAHPRHGGAGALYVVLRRKREG